MSTQTQAGKANVLRPVELFSTPLFTDPNLTHYWRFEGNSNDSIGSSNGTDTAITYNTTNGKFAQGAGFSGVSNSLIGIAFPFSTSVADFTINTWVNYSSITGGTGENIVISAGGNGVISLAYSTSAIFIQSYTGASFSINYSLSTGSWHMLTSVFTASTGVTEVFVDGASIGTLTNAGSSTTTTTAHIGIYQNQTTTYNYNGAIDDLAIFSRKLTSTEVSNLYAGTFATVTTQTQSGKARITTTSSQTQTGKTRIRRTVQQTQAGVARILTNATTQTQTGKAKIVLVRTQTQTGKGTIALARSQLLTGRAYIYIAPVYTSKYTPQSTTFTPKFSPQGTVFTDKFTPQGTQFTPKFPRPRP